MLDYNEDAEILSMGIAKAYVPQSMETTGSRSDSADATSNPSSQLQNMYVKEAWRVDGVDLVEQKQPSGMNYAASAIGDSAVYAAEV